MIESGKLFQIVFNLIYGVLLASGVDSYYPSHDINIGQIFHKLSLQQLFFTSDILGFNPQKVNINSSKYLVGV